MWDLAGRVAHFSVLFVVSVVLTRILTPSEFGTFAVVLAFVSFSGIFVDLGFRSAIVQAKAISQNQLSTVFFINVGVGLALLIVTYFIGSIIEGFFGFANLSHYLTGASSLFLINSLTLVPGGLLQRAIRLREISIINVVAACVSGSIAIYLAFSGAGVWALVSQQVISALVILLLSFYRARWWPSLSFDIRSIAELWSYGFRLFLAGVVDNFFTRLDVFVIGKLFPVQMLGIYNRSQSLDNLVKSFFAGTTTSVAFPVIARMAGNKDSIRSFYSRSLSLISFLAFLLIGVLFLTCFDVVIILFTSRWEEVGYLFRIMAVTSFVYPVSALMVILIAAMGNSADFLKLEILKKLVYVPAYLTFIYGGIFHFLVAVGVSFLVALGLNAYYVGRQIQISLSIQFWTIFKYALVAVPLTALVHFSTAMITTNYLHLLTTAGTFTFLYLLSCFLLRMDGLSEFVAQCAYYLNAKRNQDFPSAA